MMNTVKDNSMDDLTHKINQKIERLAYYRAVSRGLEQTGYEVEDWLLAEEQVLSAFRSQ